MIDEKPIEVRDVNHGACVVEDNFTYRGRYSCYKGSLNMTLEYGTCASTISVNPHDRELFLVGTEMGLIHRGSFNDKQCDATYSEHKSQVYRVQWNYLHPRVFLSCAEDYTIQIWDHTER
ncbi:dynein intermediate chain 1, axonemal [Trichonephila clavipes]|nr:dynein intermediate chain 1, axonemal [Trichonephila clavipes]